MNQAVPIHQADYSLSRDALEAFMLEQRQRQQASIKVLTGNWMRLRNAAYVGAAAVLSLDLLVTGTLGPITFIAIVLIVLGIGAKTMARRKLTSIGGGEPQPKWLIRRIVRKSIFKGREQMACSVRFYHDRIVVDQGGSHFESAYEHDKIDLIILMPGYLQILPMPVPELADEAYFIPLQAIPQADELIGLLSQKDNYLVA